MNKGKNRKILFWLKFIFLNILIIFVTFEIVLRADYFEKGFLHQKTWNPIVTLHPNPLLEHTYMPARKFRASEVYSEIFEAYGTALLGDDYSIEINKLGLRDREITPKKENEFVVLFIGDSLVAGTQVSRDNIMTSVSEKKLNDSAKEKNLNVSFRTINAGVGGYNLMNTLENYNRIKKILKPDVVVLCIFVNDIMPYSQYLTTEMNIRHFFLDNFYTLRLLKLLKNYTKLYLSQNLEPPQDPDTIHTAREKPYEKLLNSQKLSVLYPKYFPETASFIGKTSFSDSYPQRALGWLKDSITDKDLLKKFSLRPHPLSDYQSTAHIVKLIHDEVTKQNIPLIIYLLPIPSAYDDNELKFALEYYGLQEKDLNRNRLEQMLSAEIKEQIRSRDLRIIDLTAPLAAASKEHGNNVPMDCHLNSYGHRVVGEVVADEVLKLAAGSAE